MIYSEMDTCEGQPLVLTVPGLGNSGPLHWQTLWERARSDCQRAELGFWDSPLRNPWITNLARAIGGAGPPVILVAHSLGCLAAAWWATFDPQPYGWPVVGALLVAPPDPERADAAAEIAAFGPVPRRPLPFPSILVASRDDPYAEFDRSHDMASFWGSHFVDAGRCGHINADSGIGAWGEGEALLDLLIDHAAGAQSGASGWAQFLAASTARAAIAPSTGLDAR